MHTKFKRTLDLSVTLDKKSAFLFGPRRTGKSNLFEQTFPHARHLKGLRALREEALLRKYAVIAFVPHRRMIDGIEIIPWREFLAMLWGGELLTC